MTQLKPTSTAASLSAMPRGLQTDTEQPGSQTPLIAAGPLACSDDTPGYEQDCPWFDPAWLLDHPDFPLAAGVAAAIQNEEEC